MRKFLSTHREFVQIVLFVLIAIASAADTVGKPPRIVDAVGLVGSTLGIGVSIGIIVERKRQKGEEAKAKHDQ
ncbi:MAG: hypothetical protein ABSF91_15410 [Bacteroidota bacterium]|jgi:Sec-independent protein secretion pathway component TatC